MDKDKSNDETEQHQDKTKSGLQKLWESVKKETQTSKFWLEIIALVVVGTYTVFAGCQTKTANDTLAQMQDTNRPYIFSIAKFSYAQMPDPDTVTDFPVTVSLINSGPAPAIEPLISDPIVGLETDADIREHMNKCSIFYPEGTAAPMPPNQSLADYGSKATGAATHTINRHLNPDERRDVMVNHTRHLMVLGGVKYSGMKGGQYESIYCYIWNPDSMKANVFPWSMCSCNKMQ